MRKGMMPAVAPLILGGLLVATPALAASGTGANGAPAAGTAAVTGNANTVRPAEKRGAPVGQAGSEDAKDARQLVSESLNVVQEMKKDPNLVKAMEKAKGIYIVPEFGRGALIVGGRGGAGLVMAHRNGGWSDPVFFDMGGISVGAQAGASGGAIAMLLMTDNALNSFKSKNNFSLNAGAGISIVKWSANGQASWGKGDIVLWSDTAGLYAGATVSVTDVAISDDNNQAYYGRKVTAPEVMNGQVKSASADRLQHAMPD